MPTARELRGVGGREGTALRVLSNRKRKGRPKKGRHEENYHNKVSGVPGGLLCSLYGKESSVGVLPLKETPTPRWPIPGDCL